MRSVRVAAGTASRLRSVVRADAAAAAARAVGSIYRGAAPPSRGRGRAESGHYLDAVADMCD